VLSAVHSSVHIFISLTQVLIEKHRVCSVTYRSAGTNQARVQPSRNALGHRVRDFVTKRGENTCHRSQQVTIRAPPSNTGPHFTALQITKIYDMATKVRTQKHNSLKYERNRSIEAAGGDKNARAVLHAIRTAHTEAYCSLPLRRRCSRILRSVFGIISRGA